MTDEQVSRTPDASGFGERLAREIANEGLVNDLAKVSRETPLKSFRIPQPLYERAQARAAERGESLSKAVRKFLERYAR